MSCHAELVAPLARFVLTPSEMFKFSLVFVIVIFFANNYLHNFLAPLVARSHSFCLGRFTGDHDLNRYYQAAICGEHLRSDDAISASGLARFFSATGAQIVCLEIISAWFIHRRSRLGVVTFPLLLGFYVLMTGLGAAAARAFLQVLVDRTGTDEKLGWPRVWLSFFGGCLTLLLFPAFANSKGFLFGWLAVTWSRHFQRTPLSAVFIFVLLLPVLCWWPGACTPLGIFSRVVQPLFLVLLLLPSFLVGFLPVLHHLVDPLWRGFLYFVEKTSVTTDVASAPVDASGFFASLTFLWLYLISSLVVTLTLARRRRLARVWPQGVPCEIL